MGGRRATGLGRAAALIGAILVLGCSSGAPSGTATTRPQLATLAPSPTGTAGATQPAAPTDAGTTTPNPGSLATSSPAAGTPAGGPVLPSDLALYGTGLVPAGWQVVEDATGACRFAAPPDWTTDVAPGTAQTGIGEAVAGVSATTEDWESYKDTVDQFYLTGHVTLIDNDELFLIANPPTSDLDLATSWSSGGMKSTATC